MMITKKKVKPSLSYQLRPEELFLRPSLVSSKKHFHLHDVKIALNVSILRPVRGSQKGEI